MKDRMHSTIEYLTRENQSLKETIIKATYQLPHLDAFPQTTPFKSPKKYPQFAKQPQFYSMTDLKSDLNQKKSPNRLKLSKYNQS